MAKSKRNLRLPGLKAKAIEIASKKKGWKNASIRLAKDKVLADGRHVCQFMLQNAGEKKSTSLTLLLDASGKEVSAPKTVSAKSAAKQAIPSAGSFAHNLPKQDPCEVIGKAIDDHLKRLCASKFHHLENCDKDEQCGCTIGGQQTPKVDLIVLMDTSGSMVSKAVALSQAAEKALSAPKCPTDLEITWLGIGGTFNSPTALSMSSRCYLNLFGNGAPQSTPVPTGAPNCPTVVDLSDNSNYSATDDEREEGARTIADLCNGVKWREGACRAIFYISDEPIHRGTTSTQVDSDARTQDAIAAAIANDVTVFTHYVRNTPGGGGLTWEFQNYQDLADQTGGKAFFQSNATAADYDSLLNDVICNACGGCKTAKWPEATPCISINWGDSTRDNIETTDFEIVCISICNCYENLTFEDLSIGFIYAADENGNIAPLLPDGSPSVEITPIGPYCFGDIPPCVDGEAGCVSRQFALRTRGAKAGKYKLMLGSVCYRISHKRSENACFGFELVKS